MDKKKLLNVVSAGLFLVAAILWFALPAIARTEPSNSYSFVNLTFGKKEVVHLGKRKSFRFLEKL